MVSAPQEDGTRYLVIEYVPGKTLKQFIKENGALRPETAAQIMRLFDWWINEDRTPECIDGGLFT